MQKPKTTFIETAQLLRETEHSGPQFGCATEDLNVTLLSWPRGFGVESHVNSEVDVALLVVGGEGEVLVDEEKFSLSFGQVLLIPKGSQRAIRSTSESFSYFSIHRRRGALMPSLNFPTT